VTLSTASLRAEISARFHFLRRTIFSARDSHFRSSSAAPDAVIDRGIEVLRAIAKR